MKLNPDFSEAEKMKNECQVQLTLIETEKKIANEVSTQIINGNNYKSKADWQNAKVSFTKAIKLQPKNVLHYLMRADCHFLMEDFESTLIDARKSTELDKFLIDGYIYEVKCLFILSNY